MNTFIIALLAMSLLEIGCMPPKAEIKCPADIYLGKAKPNDTVKFTFPIINMGQKVLEIRKISTDCNCLLPDIKENTLINPGDSMIVKGWFFTGLASNALKSNSILIQTNINPTFQEVKLSILVN